MLLLKLVALILGLLLTVIFAANGLDLPSVRLMSTTQRQLEGKVIIEYGNGSQYTVSSQGIGQYEADMLCQQAGYAGSRRIYRNALCFDVSVNFNYSMLTVLPKCENWTDVSNCFQIAECQKRHELALRCYDEGTIELQSNKINNETDVVLEGLVTIYINGSWWTIDVFQSPRLSCFVCNSIGLDNCKSCRVSPTEQTHLQYGSGRNVSGVASYRWDCPYSGAGTIDKCNLSIIVQRIRPKKLLTVKCMLPADNRLPNYTLCHDFQGTKTEDEICEEIPYSFEPTTVTNNITAPNNQQVFNDPPGNVITIPIIVALAILLTVIVITCIVVRKLRARRKSSGVHNDGEVDGML